MSIFKELKRRNVLRVAVAYLTFSWLLIQVADTVIPVFGFGSGALSVLITLLTICFPLILLFSWVFELTPQGLRREKAVDQSTAVSVKSGKSFDRVIIVLLALALGYFAIDKFLLDPNRDETKIRTARQEGRSEAIVESYGDKSIAVMAFADMSPDSDQEYFSDGIAEELLNLLARTPGIRVISRSSAFSFKGKGLDLPAIARQLNGAHILQGSVRKSGDQVRISAQLIEAGSDTQLWSETYDRRLDDIFAIQDEIAAEIVAQLEIKLLGSKPSISRTDLSAYKYFLQAMHVGNRGTPDAWEQSIALYQKALEFDPTYAPAWSGLAIMYSLRRFAVRGSFEEIFSQARSAGIKALELDPQLASAHAILSLVAMTHDRDLNAAARHLQRGMELEPANPHVLTQASELSLALNRPCDAIAMLEILVSHDPVFPPGYYHLGRAQLYAGQLDEASSSLNTSLQLSPGFLGAKFSLGLLMLLKGEFSAALDAAERIPPRPMQLIIQAMSYHAMGKITESDSALNELIENYQQHTAFNIAYVAAYRGEADRAFDWLKNAVKYNDSGLPMIAITPWFSSIHDDPRWLPLLESVGASPSQLDEVEFEPVKPL